MTGRPPQSKTNGAHAAEVADFNQFGGWEGAKNDGQPHASR